MEMGDCILLAKGECGSFHPHELELQVKGHGKKTVLQLLRKHTDPTGSPHVLATVDRQLTNRDDQLPQNRCGVRNAAGQLQSVIAAGLADVQVVSVLPVATGVLAVRVTVCLLPEAFDMVVPERMSRTAARLDAGAAAAAASASEAAALLEVVEMMRLREPGGAEEAEALGGGRRPNPEKVRDVELVDDAGPSTSSGMRNGAAAAVAHGAAQWEAEEGAQRGSDAHCDREDGGGREELRHYSDVRDEIFDIIAPRDWHTAHPNPPGLKCRLYPYQQRALSWMVWRETQPELSGGEPRQGRGGAARRPAPATFAAAQAAAAADPEGVAAAAAAASAHLGDFASQDLFWRRVEVRGGQELWVNPYPGGGLRRAPPPPPAKQRVGILADEMGLGKTVEVIALLLARPPPPRMTRQPAQHQQKQQRPGEGRRGAAADVGGAAGGREGKEVRHSGPTLIVTPPSILQQWAIEIANHSDLKAHIYDGLRWHRHQSEQEEKAKIKEAMKKARLAAQREKEARRQERARQAAERAAKRAARQQAAQERKRAREEAATTRGSSRGRARRRGNDGRCLKPEVDDDEEAADEGNSHDHGVGASDAPTSALAAEFSGAAAAGPDAVPDSGGGSAAGPSAPSRMELYRREVVAALYAGTPLCPASCDPEAEAAEAVRKLLTADVVLTTYLVLKEEVHYSPANRVLSGLRYEKKYAVPESPLLQVRWHRLVLDEAQMVGGSYSHVVQMASRLEAVHRWCVTGTPIGAGGLDDILGLLRVLKYEPYDDQDVFRDLVSEPYRSGSAEGRSRLAALVKPLMWRNSKAVAAQDHPLPRRELQEVHLRFSAAEEAFYDVILGETRKAFNEMNNHHHQMQQRQTTQHQGPPAHGGQSSSGAADMAASNGCVGEGSGAGPGSAVGGRPPSAKQPGPVKRRRGQDRGEALAQLAGAELHQLRLACVHVQLTRYWQKLGQELALTGHPHGASGGPGAGAAPLPAIDDVMARLRDQAQLRLQNAERDLCMACNALAARLEATARKVRALAARKLVQEAAAPGGSAGAARQGAGTPAGTTLADGLDEEAVRGVETPNPAKKAKRGGQEAPRQQQEQRGGLGSPASGAAGAIAGGDTDIAAELEAAGGGAEVEHTVHPFRYTSKDKTAAALSADADRMLREAKQLLEESWAVGENGIEAATAVESVAVAAAAAGEGGPLGVDIRAAAASIRSWRFVQAHTSQMLADLLTAHPHVYELPGATPAAGRTSATIGKDGAGSSSVPAAEGSAAASADASVATAATAASLRAAELRTYVSSRVTDVRATADRELARARERLERVHTVIARLKQQLVEAYESAVACGLPAAVVAEPNSWLHDVEARLQAAQQLEAEQRAERQAAAAAGATLGLMGKEVAALLATEEAALHRQRLGLDAAAGSLLVAAAVERLRAAEGGLQGAGAAGQLEPGPEWRDVLVGGVALLLPPEGARGPGADPKAAAHAEWCLSYPPAVGLLRRAVWGGAEVQPAEMAARGIVHGCDVMTVMLCERHLKHPIRMLEARLQEQRRTADHLGTAKLRGNGLAVLLPASEAVRLRIELLRAWRELNTAELQVEVAEHQCAVVTEEVMAAAQQGQVAGMAALLRSSEEELRGMEQQLKERCNELRHKKAFFHNQYLEANRLRHAGAPGASVADRRLPAAATTGRPQPEHQQSQDAADPAVAVTGPRNRSEAPIPAAASAAAEVPARQDDVGAADAGPSSAAPGASGSDGAPAALVQLHPSADHLSAPSATSASNVGVACRTGILACLHPWEQWRPRRRRSSPSTRVSGGAGAWGGGSGPAVAAEVLDLTGADGDDPVAPAGAAGASVDVEVVMEVEAVLSVGGAGGSLPTAAAGGGAASMDGGGRPQAVDGRDAGWSSSGGPRSGLEMVSPRGVTAAAAAAGCTAAAADGAAAPLGQAAGSAQHGEREIEAAGARSAAAAAAAAARARIAAQAAAASARLGLGGGTEDGGMRGGDRGTEEEEGLSCAVCAGSLKTDIRLLPCGHYYCGACTDALMGPIGSRSCPTCRAVIRDKDDIVKAGGVSAGAAAGCPAGASGAGARQRTRGGPAADGSGEVDPPEGPEIMSVKVEGASELMCKIGALMRRLVWLRDHRPAEKSLVFSQWSDALQIVERGLRSNGVKFVTLEGGRKVRAAVSQFLHDDQCRVFLLSLRQGAAGLTLVRANHVFLLEPSLDPAIEQQAVARVHRIGQTRDVTVTRLLVDGSVEEAVMRMLKEKQQLFMEAGSGGAAGCNGLSAGPSMSAAARAGGGRRDASASLAPCAVPLLEGGEGEEASLPTAAPRQEVVAGADMSYLLNAVLR